MDFFRALANPVRIAILQRLLDKERTVNELVAAVNEERTLISHNLRKLLEIDLIRFEKRGKERVYYAHTEFVAPLFYLIENFVCSKCSIRGTCNTLKRKEIPQMPLPVNREPCKKC